MPIVVHVWNDDCVQIVVLLSIEDGQIEQSQVHYVDPLHFQTTNKLLSVITQRAYKYIKPANTQ
jgi:predicted phosphatase